MPPATVAGSSRTTLIFHGQPPRSPPAGEFSCRQRTACSEKGCGGTPVFTWALPLDDALTGFGHRGRPYSQEAFIFAVNSQWLRYCCLRMPRKTTTRTYRLDTRMDQFTTTEANFNNQLRTNQLKKDGLFSSLLETFTAPGNGLHTVAIYVQKYAISSGSTNTPTGKQRTKY